MCILAVLSADCNTCTHTCECSIANASHQPSLVWLVNCCSLFHLWCPPLHSLTCFGSYPKQRPSSLIQFLSMVIRYLHLYTDSVVGVAMQLPCVSSCMNCYKVYVHVYWQYCVNIGLGVNNVIMSFRNLIFCWFSTYMCICGNFFG